MIGREIRVLLDQASNSTAVFQAYIIGADDGSNKAELKIVCVSADIHVMVLNLDHRDVFINNAPLTISQMGTATFSSELYRNNTLLCNTVVDTPVQGNVEIRIKDTNIFSGTVKLGAKPELVQPRIDTDHMIISNTSSFALKVTASWFTEHFFWGNDVFTIAPGEVKMIPHTFKTPDEVFHVFYQAVYAHDELRVYTSKAETIHTQTNLLSLEMYGMQVGTPKINTSGPLVLGGVIKIRYPTNVDLSKYELVLNYVGSTQIAPTCPTALYTSCEKSVSENKYKIDQLQYISLRDKVTKVVHYKTYCECYPAEPWSTYEPYAAVDVTADGYIKIHVYGASTNYRYTLYIKTEQDLSYRHILIRPISKGIIYSYNQEVQNSSTPFEYVIRVEKHTGSGYEIQYVMKGAKI